MTNMHESQSDVTRRDFLRVGVAAGAVATVGMGSFYLGYGKALGKPVRVGVVGTGDEGSVLIGALNPNFLEVGAIADLRPYNRHRAFHGEVNWKDKKKAPEPMPVRPGLMSVYGWKSEAEARRNVKVYSHYQELLDKAKDDRLEAIIVALPLHLHAPVAIAAMEQGLHVLTEKLMAQTVGECKDMARAAEKTKRYLAIGHQRHYNILYWEAMDHIQRGRLGDIHSIRAQWHRDNLPDRDSWKPPLPPGAKEDEKTDWHKMVTECRAELAKATGKDYTAYKKYYDQLLAQIADGSLCAEEAFEKAEYAAKTVKDAQGKVAYECPPLEELIRWRLWDRTSAGMMAELGSHQLDAASIFVSAMHGGNKRHPLRVMATANRPVFGWDRDIEDHVYCMIEFPAPGHDEHDPKGKTKKIIVQYSSVNGNGYQGYGELVFGAKGTLALEKEQDIKILKGAGDDDAGETSITVSGGGGGPTMDTQASGPARKSAGGGRGPVSKGYAEELEHWAWCIRHPAPENQPRCGPKVAMADAIIALTTNRAAEHGAPIKFEEKWFEPDEDEVPSGDKAPTVPANKKS